MRRCRLVMLRSSLVWGCGRVPAVVLLLLSPLVAIAAPPEVPAVDPPLEPFVEFQSACLAKRIVTGPSLPHTGIWSSLSALYAGASLDSPVWDLRGVFSTRPGRINTGASLLFLTGFGPPAAMPLTELAMLQAAERRDCWTLINTDELRPFPRYFLTPGFIRDRRGISVGVPEHEAFWQTLVLAHYTSAKAFGGSARRDVTYAHLFNEPEQYRGQVIHVSGRLIRLLANKAPFEADAAGLGTFYEGWIMTDANGENPMCLVFTDLPDGLSVDNERKYNDEVRFDGYFFKRYRYEAGDSKKPNEFRDAPLLIGHTLLGRFHKESVAETAEADNWGHSLIWVFMCVVGGAVVGVIGLTFWFRYHDARVRHRLRASRATAFVPPSEEIDGERPASAGW